MVSLVSSLNKVRPVLDHLYAPFSAAIIIVGLGAAVYFIIDDALNEKIKACMIKHFTTTGMFQKANITIDPNEKFSYSDEDCQWIVDEGRAKTIKYIDALTIDACFKEQFKGAYLEPMMFAKVLEKAGHNSTGVMASVMGGTRKVCSPQPSSN